MIYTTSILNDSESPAYESSAYKESLPLLKFVEDIWAGKNSWIWDQNNTKRIGTNTSLYLPRQQEEPPEEYLKRLIRSNFERKFRDAICSTAGFLSAFSYHDFPDQFERDNVDLKGNSLEVFLRRCDELALRDDHCFILVEFPKRPTDGDGNPLIVDRPTELLMGLRPYFVAIDRRNVINWKTNFFQGSYLLEQVTIKEQIELPVGQFGTEFLTQYRVLRPGSYEIWQPREEKNGNGQSTHRMVPVEMGETSLSLVPLVPYSLTGSDDPFTGDPPLLDLAELNLKHYQKNSEKDEVMLKCNMPVLEVREITPRQRKAGDPPPKIVIGPNTVLYNVEARYVEPTGAAIIQTQEDINKLELAMQQKTLAFQSGYYAAPTATEVARSSSTAQASLASMARAKESLVQTILNYWCRWNNLFDIEPYIVVDKKLIQTGIDNATTQLLVSLRRDGELSRKGLLSLLQEGKAIPHDFDIEEELENIKNEKDGLAVLDAKEKLAKILEILVKSTIISADEAAEVLVKVFGEGMSLEEAIKSVVDIKARQDEQQQLEQLPEGFSINQDPTTRGGVDRGGIQPDSRDFLG